MVCFFAYIESLFYLSLMIARNRCFRTQFSCVRTQWIDLYQKKCVFYAKVGCNPLRIAKIVVPLHRQSEMMTLQ